MNGQLRGKNQKSKSDAESWKFKINEKHQGQVKKYERIFENNNAVRSTF